MSRKVFFIVCAVFIAVSAMSFTYLKLGYNTNYVQISTVKHDGHQYKVFYMRRGASKKRIKAKYFAAKDYNGNAVPDRYDNWQRGKNVICASSGTYMSNCDGYNATPVGLTIDNGVVVNRTLEDFDGLVIVYATGGVVATNLEDKDLTVQGGNISGVKLDLKGNSLHRNQFIKWCKDKEATVFQTHLLVYKNELKFGRNASRSSRERRFLAVGYDDDGQVVHCIVHSPENTSLYEGSKRVLKFLNDFKEMDVTYMINLDTGCQDIFELRNSNGSKNNTMRGRKSIRDAANLLTYYYE